MYEINTHNNTKLNCYTYEGIIILSKYFKVTLWVKKILKDFHP